MTQELEVAIARKDELRDIIITNNPNALTEGNVDPHSGGLIDAAWTAGQDGEWAYGRLERDEDKRVHVYLSRLGGMAVARTLVQVSIIHPYLQGNYGVYQLHVDNTVRTSEYSVDDCDEPYLTKKWQPAFFNSIVDILTATTFQDKLQ